MKTLPLQKACFCGSARPLLMSLRCHQRMLQVASELDFGNPHCDFEFTYPPTRVQCGLNGEKSYGIRDNMETEVKGPAGDSQE